MTDDLTAAFYADCARPRADRGRKGRNGMYACPCCFHFTLAARGNYNICGVCFWEDDGQDDHDADAHHYFSPNHGVSLTEARANFQEFGACERDMLPHVEPPTADELPDAVVAVDPQAADTGTPSTRG